MTIENVQVLLRLLAWWEREALQQIVTVVQEKAEFARNSAGCWRSGV
jgi:hypothetical protein